jgi:hypothetical protein
MNPSSTITAHPHTTGTRALATARDQNSERAVGEGDTQEEDDTRDCLGQPIPDEQAADLADDNHLYLAERKAPP